jgi:hypothetical protein
MEPKRETTCEAPAPLAWTVHATDRSRQRAIPKAIAELAYAEGRPLSRRGDRYLLTRERVRELLGFGYDLTLLARAEKAAPVVVVVSTGAVLSVFRPIQGIKREWRRTDRAS